MTGQYTDQTAGGLGIGVVQPQSGLDYPFVSPGLGVQTSAVADVENLFADFYLSYDDPGYYKHPPAVTNPLRIYWLYGFGDGAAWSLGAQPSPAIAIPAPTHDVDLVVVDSLGTVVFNSATADYFTATSWGTYYTIYEWRKTTKPNEAVCRAVKYDKVHNNLTLPVRPVEYCPRNAVLDERTIEKIPKRVLALRVQNGECVTPWFKEKVSFVNGHNTELEMGATATQNLRRTTAISFAAAAGSGAGQYGLCATGLCVEDAPTNVCPPGEDPVIDICTPIQGEEIKTINGAKPNDAGNIFLNATDCLWFRKPAAYTGETPHNYERVNNLPVRSVMAIGADCAPCCACEDYLETAKYMTNLGEYYSNIGNRVTDVKKIHEENIGRWEQQRECRNKRPLELLLIQQPCPCMDVILFYCNHCDTCAENVVLTVNFTATPAPDGVALDSKYTKLVADNRSNSTSVTGGWPTFSVQFPTVSAGASVYSQFRICFCPQHPYAISGTLTGIKTGGPILAGCVPAAPAARIEASQILDCQVASSGESGGSGGGSGGGGSGGSSPYANLGTATGVMTLNDVTYTTRLIGGSYNNHPQIFNSTTMPWWGSRSAAENAAQEYLDSVLNGVRPAQPPIVPGFQDAGFGNEIRFAFAVFERRSAAPANTLLGYSVSYISLNWTSTLLTQSVATFQSTLRDQKFAFVIPQ